MIVVFVLAAICVAAAVTALVYDSPGFKGVAHLSGWTALGLSLWINVLNP